MACVFYLRSLAMSPCPAILITALTSSSLDAESNLTASAELGPQRYMTTKLNTEGILLLEQPFVRVRNRLCFAEARELTTM